MGYVSLLVSLSVCSFFQHGLGVALQAQQPPLQSTTVAGRSSQSATSFSVILLVPGGGQSAVDPSVTTRSYNELLNRVRQNEIDPFAFLTAGGIPTAGDATTHELSTNKPSTSATMHLSPETSSITSSLSSSPSSLLHASSTNTVTLPTISANKLNESMIATTLSPSVLSSHVISSLATQPSMSMPNKLVSNTGRPDQWEIIGIAVISFCSVALVITGVIFFDHWWSFIRPFICKRDKRHSGLEELIDWNRGSWAIATEKESGFPYSPDSALIPPFPPRAHVTEKSPPVNHAGFAAQSSHFDNAAACPLPSPSEINNDNGTNLHRTASSSSQHSYVVVVPQETASAHAHEDAYCIEQGTT